MGRRRREEGPALDRTRLIEAVKQLALAEGEGAVNMRRVAAKLGVSSRLLYRHVRDKAELLELVAEAITRDIALPSPGDAWDAKLLKIARATREVVRRYPGAPYRVLINSTQRLEQTPIRRMEAVIFEAFDQAGLTPAQARDAYVAISSYAMGHLMLCQAYETGAESAERMAMTADELEATFEGGLAMLLAGMRLAAAQNAPAVADPDAS